MGSVGLLYVGAVLFLNGLALLGRVDARSAVPLNLFVGFLQVLTPTYLIFTAGGDTAVILNASGLYLFGFTYAYVALNQLMHLDGTGLGYFSLFVAICAIAYSVLNFTMLGDPAFAVVWLHWAMLWTLFFLVLGLRRESLTRFTGWVCVVQGWATAAIPAFLLLTDTWQQLNAVMTVLLALIGLAYVALYPRLAGRQRSEVVAAA